MRSRSGKVLATILTVAMVVSSAVPVLAKSYSGTNFSLVVDDECLTEHGKFHIGEPVKDIMEYAHGEDKSDEYGIASINSSSGNLIVPGEQKLTVTLSEPSTYDPETFDVEGGYYDDDYKLVTVSGVDYTGTNAVGKDIEVDEINISANIVYFGGNKDVIDAWDGKWNEFEFAVSPTKIEKEGENKVTLTVKHNTCTPLYTDDDVTKTVEFTIVGVDDNPIKDNGYTKEQNEALTFDTERTVIKEAKTKKGQTVSLDMALYTAEAVMWNGKPGKFNKKSDKRNNLPIDIDKSKVSVNGVEVEIKAVKIKNTKKAYVSQNSIFAKTISEANLAEYKKVEEKGKKLPSYFIQLKAPKGADKDTKKAVSTANKYLKENPVYFEIVPIQLAYDTLTVEMNKKGTKIKKLTSSKAGDAKLKKKTDYKAEIKDNTAIIEGVVNYNGKKVVSLK